MVSSSFQVIPKASSYEVISGLPVFGDRLLSIVDFYRIMFSVIERIRSRLVWFLNRRTIRHLEDQVSVMFAERNIGGVIVLLEQLQSDYCWPFQTEFLLFKRAMRPSSVDLTVHLLSGVHFSSVLLPHQTFYAGIALIHEIIRHRDLQYPPKLVSWLLNVCELDREPFPYVDLNTRNRESGFKQLVSARSCLLQYCFAQESDSVDDLIEEIGLSNLVLMESSCFSDISADVLYRSVSNLMRGLLTLTLYPSVLNRLLLQIDRLVFELQRRRYFVATMQAHEDHRFFLKQCHELVLESSKGPGLDSCSRLKQLILNCSADYVHNGFDLWVMRRFK